MASARDTFDRLVIARPATVRLFEFHINSMIPLPSTGPWGGDTSASSVVAMAEPPPFERPEPDPAGAETSRTAAELVLRGLTMEA